MMRMLVFLLLIAVETAPAQPKPRLVLGDEQLAELVAKVKGQRVALLVNHTALIGKTHLADTLQSLQVNLVKIFSPEHGFRGIADAGEHVSDGTDVRTHLPIVSLYGNSRKPAPEHLQDVDVVLFDIQDVGARYYTYIGTMHYMMEACAEQKKKFIVLDRPNPNGSYTDGPVLKPEFKSFVGMHTVPVVHGLTVGEYARMINGERWLKEGVVCDLEVMSMKNYSHDLPFPLPVKPSPNLPNDHAIALYPSICLFEGTVMSLGRGTLHAFEMLGHPDLKNQPFQFTPVSIENVVKNPPHENKVCYGINLQDEKVKKEVSLTHLIHFYQIFPDKEKFFISSFNRLAGSAELQEQIRSGMTEAQIRATWQKDLAAYREIRKKYLLYP